MISFACPRCKAEYYYADDMAGKKIRCLGPKCGQKLLVPGLAPPTVIDTPDAAGRPAPRLSRPQDAAKSPPAASRKKGAMGDRERLFKQRLGDLCLKVSGLYAAPVGAINDMQRELIAIANEFRQLAESFDAGIGSSF